MINYSQNSLCISNNEKDIEDLVSDNQINIKKNTLIPLKDEKNIKNFVSDLIKIKLDEDEKQNLIKYNEYFMNLRKKYNINPKKSQLFFIYRQWK